MVVALSARAIACEREAPLTVRYRGVIVGAFRADLLVERAIIVEVKVSEKITTLHQRQLLNYLRVSGLSVGLILNVGERPSVRRMIWTGERP
jgi:GxxExxY protein